jgi:hypothetical protein
MRRRVSAEKKVSAAFSQEVEVGVKWKTQQGLRARQRSTLGACGCVVVEDHVDHLAGWHRGLERVEEA